MSLVPLQRETPRTCGCVVASIGTRRVFIMFGGPVYRIQAEGAEKSYTFEWSDMFGPSRCHSVTGDLLKNSLFPERSPFWPLFERWTAGGKKVDEFGRCILAPLAAVRPCGPCDGRGWFKFAGDRRRHACPECRGDGTVVVAAPSRDDDGGEG